MDFKLQYFLQPRRCRKLIVGVLLVFILGVIIFNKNKQEQNYHIVHNWKLNFTFNKNTSSEHKYFIKTHGEESYFLSAVASPDKYSIHKLNLVLSGFDGTKGYSQFQCCVLRSDGAMLTTPAKFHNKHNHNVFLPSITQLFYQAEYVATQYVCSVPQTNNGVRYVNLTTTTSTCRDQTTDFLPIEYQRQVKEGLAICAKVAYGHLLKPSRLIEWFEMQKILGVDKILVYDLGCSENIKSVFRHYVIEGLLEVQPYSLPGHIPSNPNRGFIGPQIQPQFSHDKHLTVLDCHQRLGGYDYILAADFDELTIPKEEFTLKQLLKNLRKENPRAAGFYFYVQFHLEEWGRYRNDTDIFFQQYVTSGKPKWECEKYIYIPSRVYTARIHSFNNMGQYTSVYVKPEIATIHHYRKCPQGWSDCNPEVMVDNQITKYEAMHTKNTHIVLQKLNLK